MLVERACSTRDAHAIPERAPRRPACEPLVSRRELRGLVIAMPYRNDRAVARRDIARHDGLQRHDQRRARNHGIDAELRHRLFLTSSNGRPKAEATSIADAPASPARANTADPVFDNTALVVGKRPAVRSPGGRVSIHRRIITGHGRPRGEAPRAALGEVSPRATPAWSRGTRGARR